MSYYSGVLKEEDFKGKVAAAKQASAFALPSVKEDDSLLFEYVSFASKEDHGQYVGSRTVTITSVLVVSALLLNITTSFLLNPPTAIAPPATGVFDSNGFVRVAFYGNLISTACFMVSILFGITTLMKQQWAILGEFDAPIFFYHTARLYFVCWFSMVVGVVIFLLTICVIILALYHPVDAGIGIGVIILCTIIVNAVVIYYDRKWGYQIPAARLAELKKTSLLND